MKLAAKISDEGALLMPDRAMLTDWLHSNKGKSVALEIKVVRNKRSNPQNRYYWSSIVNAFYMIFRGAGIDVQDEHDAHEILKAKFNTEKIVKEDTGEVIEIPKSTTRNDTAEQEEYHEKCRRRPAEFWGVQIALPNEQLSIIDTVTILADKVGEQGVIVVEGS